MQTNVPKPYSASGSKDPLEERSTHLNMPGAHWAQADKYISGERIANHPLSKKYAGTVPPLLIVESIIQCI